jgi:hypothetical protein
MNKYYIAKDLISGKYWGDSFDGSGWSDYASMAYKADVPSYFTMMFAFGADDFKGTIMTIIEVWG